MASILKQRKNACRTPFFIMRLIGSDYKKDVNHFQVSQKITNDSLSNFGKLSLNQNKKQDRHLENWKKKSETIWKYPFDLINGKLFRNSYTGINFLFLNLNKTNFLMSNSHTYFVQPYYTLFFRHQYFPGVST